MCKLSIIKHGYITKQQRKEIMKRKGVLSFAVCALAIFGIFFVAQGKTKEVAPKSQSKMKKYLGAEVMALLSNPKKVEAFRVHEATRQTWAQSKPKTLSKRDAKKLSAILSDETRYEWDNGKPVMLGCIFNPAVAYRFKRDEKFVSVLVCFRCSQVLFVPDGLPNVDKEKPAFRLAWVVELRPDVLQITKNVFPGDQEIQQMK